MDASLLAQSLSSSRRRSATTPPTQTSPLDLAISQLLKDQPNQDDVDYVSQQREQSDFNSLWRVQFECNTGDTLVIVDFPSGYVNCKRDEWSSKRFCVHSEKLLATGSKVFAALLSPAKQARIRRRFEHAGESIQQQFILDLTPSVEGDELAAQLIDLSLSPGTRDWWTSKERLDVASYLVSGHDDHCPNHPNVPVNCKKTNEYVPESQTSSPKVDLADMVISKSRAIDDYCPIRHRANIIRLILAIEGRDLVLNSAPRVYTLTGIANILDCTNVIRDSVCTWLMAEPNTAFIDINTEPALKIAWTLKLENVARAAFRILVVEGALDVLAAQPRRRATRHTIFGRPRADLPDDLQTVIQHAAHKLADRVQQTYAKFISDQFYELFDIPEYQKLKALGDLIRRETSAGEPAWLSRVANQLVTLSDKLMEYKDWILRKALDSGFRDLQRECFDRNRRCYISRKNWLPATYVYSKLSDTQRLLTPGFWEHLSDRSNITESGLPDAPAALIRAIEEFNRNIDDAMGYISHSQGPLELATHHFDFFQFRDDLNTALSLLSLRWIHTEPEVPLTRTSHIVLTLCDEEFKYLPLWAGGLEDGTGGVFESAVPDAEMGPVGPGPAYRTGTTVVEPYTDTTPSISPSNATPATPSRGTDTTFTAGRSLKAVGTTCTLSTRHQNDDQDHGRHRHHPPAPTRTTTIADVVPIDSSVSAASVTTLDSEDEELFEHVHAGTYSDVLDDEETWSDVGNP